MYNYAQATMPYRSLLAKSHTVVALLLLAACEHDAWLGMQCPSADMRCDAVDHAAHSGSSNPDSSIGPTAPDVADSGAASTKQDAATEGHDAPAMHDAATASACRNVGISFFACAGGNETAGAPQLQAGRAYTLRFRSTYKIDTTFQIQGSTAACTAVMFGTLTVPAGAATVERCLTPTENIALLVTVMSGDVQVWMQNGLMAELCEGCS